MSLIRRAATTEPSDAIEAKTGKSQRVIGAPAMLLLSELPRDGDSPCVFPGREVGNRNGD